MGQLKRTLLLSFRTKVIVPVLGVMALLLATSMLLVNQRVTRQLQADAAEQLATADAVLKHSQQLRLDNVLALFRKAESEPRFKALATLFDRDHKKFSEAAQKTIRKFLTTLLDENFAAVITVVPLDGPPLTVAREVWVRPDEFTAASAALATRANTHGTTAGLVRNGEQLLDAVAVPIRLQDEVVATFVFGVKDTLADDVRKITRAEVLLLASGQVVGATAQGQELQVLLSEQITRAAAGPVPIQKIVLHGEHYLCLGGSLAAPGGVAGDLNYLILSSYEKPLQVLYATQQLIVIVSMAAIGVGMMIVWIYVRRVTAPLEELRAHTEALGRGDFTRRVELNSRDEFGDLAEAFNQMTENLKSSRQQLEATVDTLKTTQSQLIQSEKLSGIGEFVAGVTHELNNPLTTVMGFSELLQQTGATPQQKRHLEMIHKSAVRCRKIVQNLLSFSRRHKPERNPAHLNQLIEEAVDILGYQLRTSNIEVITQLDPQLPPTLVDAHQLQQVFINIINNGRQAMEAHQPKGKIHITTSLSGATIKISFRDNGPGIRPENISKLFDPFFTTKEVGKGTGLGLSICYGIIKEHGGTIVVESNYGAGAAFLIELPVTRDTDQHTHNPDRLAKPATPALTGGGKSVLVIDDEESILQMVTEILSRSGYQTDAASDGESGVQRAQAKAYDLVICDWKMPGLNGQQVFERLTAADPAMAGKMIFMTGDVINDQVRCFLEKQNRPCLNKPFALRDFEEMIQASLPVC